MKFHKSLIMLISVAFVLSLSACTRSSSPDNNTSDIAITQSESNLEPEKNTLTQPTEEMEYLITKISYFDNNLSLLYTNTYEYNDEGNIITYSCDRYYKDSYEYDEHGRLITVIHYAAGEIDSRDEYEYNDFGLISKCTSYYKQVNDFITAEYKYDSFGNKTSMTYTKLSKFVLGNFYDSTYEYDGDTLLTETQMSNGQAKQYIEYDYGKNQKNITAYSDNGTTMYYTEWYLTEGDEICLKQVIYDSTTGGLQIRTDLEYDSNGKLTNGMRYWNDTLKDSFELEYDSNGNLFRQTYYDQMGFITQEIQYEYEQFFSSKN